MSKFKEILDKIDWSIKHLEEYPLVGWVQINLTYEDLKGLSWKEINKLKIKYIDEGVYIIKIMVFYNKKELFFCI